jgi:erythromycin esterase-like protein
MPNTRVNIKYSVLLFLLSIAGDWQVYSAAFAADSTSAIENSVQESTSLPDLIFESSEHFTDIDSANLDGLLQRIGDARVVLLGESTHGTREFYEMRARITRELIEKKGFTIIAAEADWPDASSIDHYVRYSGRTSGRTSGRDSDHRLMYRDKPFTGFPEWMWANHSVLAFTHWLKDYNQRINSVEHAVGFYGIDFYNMFGSIRVVLDYLRDIDPKSAEIADWHYSCLLPWVDDPSSYSRVSRSPRYRICDQDVASVLHRLLKDEQRYSTLDKQRYFSVVQNAWLITKGERYFRTMHDDNTASKNQRDNSMFETLQAILNYRGPTSKAVVWAHNSHIGDSSATEFSGRGEINLGERVRDAFADKAYLIGFGTDHGNVTAASQWGAPAKVMLLSPSHEDSIERICHDVKADNFILPLRDPSIRKKLLTERLQRAIGVAYDPVNELRKHYFYGTLPRQYDEYIWFDETQAVKPLSRLFSPATIQSVISE